MFNVNLTDSVKFYTKESFPKFIRSSETRCYLMPYNGRVECVKLENMQSEYYPGLNYPIILLKADAMLGYKAFNKDWTCRGKQYDVGETFKEDIELPIPCESGMHFCNELVDVFYYYRYDFTNTRVAEVRATGAITTIDGEKFCTNELKIIREVYPDEILGSIRDSVYEKLMTSLPTSVAGDVMEKLRLEDERILKFHGIFREDCDKING